MKKRKSGTYWLPVLKEGVPARENQGVWQGSVVDMSTNVVRAQVSSTKAHRALITSLLSSVKTVENEAPSRAEFVLFMLSRQRREDVMADLDDWYPTWCEKFGTRRAKFLVWWRVACCIGGVVLEVAGRVTEVIGKVIAIK